MLDLNRTHSLTSKPVDLSSPAKPSPLDLAITDLWSENQKLFSLIQMLCGMNELNLSNDGLEGFRNILGGVNEAIDKVLELADENKDAAKNITSVLGLEQKARFIDQRAMNAYVRVLNENKEKTVGEVMPEAESAFNRTITEECKKAGIANEEALTATPAEKEDAHCSWIDPSLPGNDR